MRRIIFQLIVNTCHLDQWLLKLLILFSWSWKKFLSLRDLNAGASLWREVVVLQQMQIRIESRRESKSELVNKRGLTGFIPPRRCLSVDLGRHSQHADGISTCVAAWVLLYFEDVEHKPSVHNKQTCKNSEQKSFCGIFHYITQHFNYNIVLHSWSYCSFIICSLLEGFHQFSPTSGFFVQSFPVFILLFHFVSPSSCHVFISTSCLFWFPY